MTNRAYRERMLLSDSEDGGEESEYSDDLTDEGELDTGMEKGQSLTTTSIFGFIAKDILLKQLLKKAKGNLHSSSSTRLLKEVCDGNPDLFGGPRNNSPRKRRKQVQNFVDKFKRRNTTTEEVNAACKKITEQAINEDQLFQQRNAARAAATLIKKSKKTAVTSLVCPAPAPRPTPHQAKPTPFSASLSKLTSPIKTKSMSSRRSVTSGGTSRSSGSAGIPSSLRVVTPIPEDAGKSWLLLFSHVVLPVAGNDLHLSLLSSSYWAWYGVPGISLPLLLLWVFSPGSQRQYVECRRF